MALFNKHAYQSGYSLIELLVAIGLFGILVSVLFAGFIASKDEKPQQQQRLQAITILKGTTEAIRIVRSSGWSNVAQNGVFHPVVSGNLWALSSGADTINGLTRQVTISDVYRSSGGSIVTSGGTFDPSTKKVVVQVSWNQPLITSLSTTMYFTRYLDNLSFTNTTLADFTGVAGNLGILTNTSVVNNAGGEVSLTNNANADWCKPQNFIVNQIDLPKLSNAIYAQQGGVWLGSGDGSAGSPAFINVTINTPAPPASPSAAVAGTFNGAFTTNSIYSDGTYVFLATDDSPQIKILSLSSNPYTQVGTVTIPGGSPANSVYVANNILFATSGSSLYTFDVTTRTGSHTTAKSSVAMITGIWTQPTARQVVVVNNRAYVGTGGSLLGLQVFSFNADGSNLQFQTAALLTFSQQSQGLYVDPSAHYAYMAFNNSNGAFARGFVVVDLTKTSWFLITYYNTSYTYNSQGMDPRGITVPVTNRAVVVGVGGTQQYQVIDLSNLSNMTMCGSLVINSGVLGISSILDSYSNAYSYIITGESSNRFKIIRGGVGGGGYLSSGSFESPAFNSGKSAGFNRFTATITQPTSTAVSMQIGVAAPVTGSCSAASYTYIGPDGTTGTFFTPVSSTISGTIPFNSVSPTYANPNQCFKYKAFLTSSNVNSTPLLNDMTVNYSP